MRPCGAIDIGSAGCCEAARGDAPRSCDTSRFSERGVAGELMAVSAATDVEDEGSGGIELDEDEIVDEADENVSPITGAPFGRPRGAAGRGSAAATGVGASARGGEGGACSAGAGGDSVGVMSTGEALADEATGAASSDSSAGVAIPLAGAATSAGDGVDEDGAFGLSPGVEAGSEGAGFSGEVGAGEATSWLTSGLPFSPTTGDLPMSTISIAVEASTEPFFFFLLAFFDEADLGADGSGLTGSDAAGAAAPPALILCRMRLSVGRAST